MQQDALHDEIFGELGYGPSLEEWYGGVTLTPDRRVEITIWWNKEGDEALASVLERARAAYLEFCQHEPAHRKTLATAMLERHRVSARVPVELPDVNTLAHSLTASQLSIAADGSATAHYTDCTELFGDHCIVVDLDVHGSFVGFSLHG